MYVFHRASEDTVDPTPNPFSYPPLTKSSNALVTALVMRLSMDGGIRLPSDDTPACQSPIP